MRRTAGLASLVVAVVAAAIGGYARATTYFADWPPAFGVPIDALVATVALGAAVVFGLYGIYLLALAALMRTTNKRRIHDLRNVLRLAFGLAGAIAVLGVLTEQWLGLLFSFGVIGFAVTFALQQPLLSLIAWAYIMVKRPYAVGDRVRIGDAKGDVISVDFLVTTIWEVNGELVSSNQPSGRVVTVPNSVVLSSEVFNFGGGGSPYIWNEITVQVAYETDLEFARSAMIEEADDLLGDEMAARIADYRDALAETPVELEVYDRPTVNVVQTESWVELKLRYLAHPRRGQRAKNQLYERVLARFNDNPDRVSFPIGRNR